MSGSVVHRFVAHLVGRRLRAVAGCEPVARAVAEHPASLLAGSYEGADLMIMPVAICTGCGRIGGHEVEGQVDCAWCGHRLRRYRFGYRGTEWDALAIHNAFYLGSHLSLPVTCTLDDRGPLDTAARRALFRQVLNDAARGDYGSPLVPAEPERAGEGLAFAVGWVVHVVIDLVMKGAWPTKPLDCPYLDGLYGAKSRMAWELVILTSLSADLGLTYDELLFGLPGGDDNGVMLHYLRVNEPEQYAHWPACLAVWPPRPDQAGLLAAHLAAHRPFFQVAHLTSQLAAGQAASDWPGERTPLDRLLHFQLDGLDADTLLARACAAGVPAALWTLAELAVAEVALAVTGEPVVPAGDDAVGTAWSRPAATAAEPVAGSEQLEEAVRAGFFRQRGVIVASPGRPETDRLAALAARRTGWPLVAEPAAGQAVLALGAPAANPVVRRHLPEAEALRLKYREGRQAWLGYDPAGAGTLCLAGLCDRGDERLARRLEPLV